MRIRLRHIWNDGEKQAPLTQLTSSSFELKCEDKTIKISSVSRKVAEWGVENKWLTSLLLGPEQEIHNCAEVSCSDRASTGTSDRESSKLTIFEYTVPVAICQMSFNAYI